MKLIVVIFYIYVPFIVLASVELHSTRNVWLCIATGFLVALTAWWRMQRSSKLYLRAYLLKPTLLIAAIGVFQWTASLNWCSVLYLLVIVQEFLLSRSLKRGLTVGLFGFVVYELTRFTYVPYKPYDFLVTFSDALYFSTLVWVGNYVSNLLHERSQLRDTTKRLAKVDPMTGLFNFEAIYEEAMEAVSSQHSFKMGLMAVSNHLFERHSRENVSIPEAVKAIADELRERLPPDSVLGRYGHDSFIVFLLDESNKHVRGTASNTAGTPGTSGTSGTSETFDFLKSIQAAAPAGTVCGCVHYPLDGGSVDALLFELDGRVLQIQEEDWRNREHVLRQSEKKRMIGEMAAALAHEIRNPLTTVKGLLQVTESQGYNVAPWYELMMGEIDHMASLTREFLQFSRPHSGLLKNSSIKECILRCYRLLESEAAQRGHELRLRLPEEDRLIPMDPEKMTQVIVNLIQNALEAVPKRAGLVELELQYSEDETVISVTDNGPGIKPEDRQRIFEPFFTRKSDGTGLGLFICRQLVESHHGTIVVTESAEGGALFEIRLPVSWER